MDGGQKPATLTFPAKPLWRFLRGGSAKAFLPRFSFWRRRSLGFVDSPEEFYIDTRPAKLVASSKAFGLIGAGLRERFCPVFVIGMKNLWALPDGAVRKARLPVPASSLAHAEFTRVRMTRTGTGLRAYLDVLSASAKVRNLFQPSSMAP